MKKNLIIYYSRKGENYWNGGIKNLKKGNSEKAAEYIAEAIGADLFEIETEEEYPKDYYETIEIAQEELKNNSRPKLKKELNDISDYDNIFIVGPCWWGKFPMAIFTQLEALDFSNKNIYPLMTSEGSGLGNTINDIAKAAPGGKVNSGLNIHGAETEKLKNKIQDWAKKSIS